MIMQLFPALFMLPHAAFDKLAETKRISRQIIEVNRYIYFPFYPQRHFEFLGKNLMKGKRKEGEKRRKKGKKGEEKGEKREKIRKGKNYDKICYLSG